MQKIKIVIVEDEFIISEDIKAHLVAAGYDVMAVFDQASTAFDFISTETPDLMLVDIQLVGETNGIQLVEQIQTRLTIPIIYITANSDAQTYERAKRTRPHSFLVKPFTPANLLAAIDLALYHFSIDQPVTHSERIALKALPDEPFMVNQCLFIRANGRYKKVCGDDLLFVEASGSYVHIQTRTDRYTLSQNLAQFQKKTPLPNLIRIHRSYIVNLDKVESFDESSVLVQRHKLPISDHYKEEFLARIHCL